MKINKTKTRCRPDPTRDHAWRSVHRGFTLVELLTAIAIATFVASMMIVALAQVREDAREMRTKAQIARIHHLLMTRWDSYQTRKVPLSIAATATDIRAVGRQRLNAIRELMRAEMPDRKTDVQDDPVTLPNIPSLMLRYRRVVGDMSAWTTEYQGAECLYMILASIQTEGGTGIDFIRDDEIGDLDNDGVGDGMPEILDGWGNPIEFIRWPVGLSATRQTPMFDTNGDNLNDRSWSVIQYGDQDPTTDGNAGDSPDPFDYLRVDTRWTDTVTTNDPFALYPLVVSAGPDKQFDIIFDTNTLLQFQTASPLQYSTTSPGNDPYVQPQVTGPPAIVFPQIGEPADQFGGLGSDPVNAGDAANPDGIPDAGYWDNINNHTGLEN